MRIFAVVVNYNTTDYVEDLLRSLEQSPEVSVVVVDNKSDADNVAKLALLEEKFDRMDVVYLPANAGFAGGVHAGVARCDAQIDEKLWILNPDTLVDKNASARLSEVLDESSFALVSPLIVTGTTDAERVWFAGGKIDLKRGRTTHDFFDCAAAEFQESHKDPYSTGFLTGAAPMMTFKTWYDLGGFRTDFFMYWEDADFSRRAMSKGLTLGVVPAAEIWHAVGAASASSGKSPLYYRFMLRNRIICMAEEGGLSSLLSPPALVETATMFVRAWRGGEGRRMRLSAMLSGIREGIGVVRSESTTHAGVELCTSRDFMSWESRYLRGEVPGRHPYGLDHFAELGTTAQSIDLAPVKSIEGLISASQNVLRKATRSVSSTTGLAWEENYALRMVLQRNYVRKYSGVIWATDELSKMSPIRKVMLERTLEQLDGIWCLNFAQIEVLRTWLGSRCPPTHHVRFGIDTGFFTPHPAGARPLVASLGIDRDRDRSTLIQAFELVLRERADAELVVQGELPSGTFRHANIRTVQRLSHAEVRTLYRDAAVVAVPTRPNLHVSGMTVALEAMATGRPVVMSRTAGMDSYVPDFQAGKLVDPGNPDQLAAGILEYLDDPESRDAAGRFGLEHVHSRHTSQQMVEAISAIIEGPR